MGVAMSHVNAARTISLAIKPATPAAADESTSQNAPQEYRYRTSCSILAYSPLRTGIERDLFSVPPPLVTAPTPSRDRILGRVRQGIQYATDPHGIDQSFIPPSSTPSISYAARNSGSLDDLYSSSRTADNSLRSIR